MTLRFSIIVAVLLCTSGLIEGEPLDRKRIELTNDLDPATDLQVHCKSGDDDLGPHTLKHGESYSWRFRVNFFQTTQFFCNFQWTENGAARNHWVDIYKNANIFTVECTECLWKVRQKGVCRWLYGEFSCLRWKK